MQQSRRAKRMQRHHKRYGRGSALNLVSLMDIFTILVFFLLVNSADVEVLPSAKDIELPESTSTVKPQDRIVVMISGENILIQGKAVVATTDVLNSEQSTVAPLLQAIKQLEQRALQRDNASTPEDREINIMADRDTPYKLLKKVMLTCTEANFGKISLAVLQRPEVVNGS